MSQIVLPESAPRRRKSDASGSSSDGIGLDQESRSESSSDDEDAAQRLASPLDDSIASSCREATIFKNVMKQSNWKQRIDRPREGNGNDLIAPCLCVGYRSRHHKRCIEEWVELTGATSCPFCQVRYEFTRTKKSILDYFRELELQEAFQVNFGMFAFSIYLLLVGLSICYDFLHAACKCEPGQLRGDSIDAETLAKLKNWRELEELIDCHRSATSFQVTYRWPLVILFWFTCIGCIVLFLSITSLCLKFIMTHYLRYLLWSKTNFKVSMEPYRLMG